MFRIKSHELTEQIEALSVEFITCCLFDISGFPFREGRLEVRVGAGFRPEGFIWRA